MTAPIVTPRSLVAMLWAHSHVDRMPVDGWPVEAAIEALAQDVEVLPVLGPAVRELLSPIPRADRRVVGIRGVLREAAAAGDLVPEGQGGAASYRATEAWLSRHSELIGHLSQGEQEALDEAAQRLVAMATIWSKRWVA